MTRISLLLLPLIIACLLIPTSCVTRDYQVTEPYAETQYRTEIHTEIINETQKYIEPDWNQYIQMYITVEGPSRVFVELHFDGYKVAASDNISNRLIVVPTNSAKTSTWAMQVFDLTGKGPITELPLVPAYQNQLINGRLGYAPTDLQQRWIDNFDSIVNDPERSLYSISSDEFSGEDLEVNLGHVSEFTILTLTPMQQYTSHTGIISKVQLITTEEKMTEEKIPYRVTKERTVTKTEQVPFWEVWFNKFAAPGSPSQ